MPSLNLIPFRGELSELSDRALASLQSAQLIVAEDAVYKKVAHLMIDAHDYRKQLAVDAEALKVLADEARKQRVVVLAEAFEPGALAGVDGVAELHYFPLIRREAKAGALPLAGKTIAVTRSAHQSGELVKGLKAKGANVLELPLISIESYKDGTTLQDVFAEFGSYEWLIFTSANGVHSFFQFFIEHFGDIRCLGCLQIAAVGESTAKALEAYHLKVDFMPKEHTATGLALEFIADQNIENLKILVARGNLNKEDLVKLLEEQGKAIVDQVQVYSTKLSALEGLGDVQAFKRHGADAIVFASPSAVESFTQQATSLSLAENIAHPVACSIGPVTSEALKAKGISPKIEAKSPSAEGIIAALEGYFSTKA